MWKSQETGQVAQKAYTRIIHKERWPKGLKTKCKSPNHLGQKQEETKIEYVYKSQKNERIVQEIAFENNKWRMLIERVDEYGLVAN